MLLGTGASRHTRIEIFLPIPSALRTVSRQRYSQGSDPQSGRHPGLLPSPTPPTHRNGSDNATFCGRHDAGHARLRGVHPGILDFEKFAKGIEEGKGRREIFCCFLNNFRVLNF